jgi:hypothetical protein
MQESEFTGCVNKVQGSRPAGEEKHQNHGLFRASRKNNSAAALTPRGATIDASRRFLYDELGKGA